MSDELNKDGGKTSNLPSTGIKIDQSNLSQIANMSKHIHRRGKKYTPIFPREEGIQQNTSDRNPEALLDVDRKHG